MNPWRPDQSTLRSKRLLTRAMGLIFRQRWVYFSRLIRRDQPAIPVISTIYRSISGDTIDPGAKIAGGTLFGGPIGAAFSSLDVAVKHRTGHDIANHATAFFINTTGNESTPTLPGTSLKTAALEPVQLAERLNGGQAAVSVLQPIDGGRKPPRGESFYRRLPATQISVDRFRAAGMAAIPIAKRPSSGYGQRQPMR